MLFTLDIGAVMVNVYKTISIIGYSLAALCFILSITIFFMYDIRGVYAYLTGRKQKKRISEMRKKQGDEGEGVPVPPSVRFGFKPAPKKIEEKHHSAPVVEPVVSKQDQPVFEKGDTGGETAPLSNVSQEVHLQENTPVSHDKSDNDNPSIINSDDKPADEGTTVLNQKVNNGSFVLVKNEMLIHTNEIL